MSWPDPQPGLVIRYADLWRREAFAGQDEGSKDRPCAVVLARTDEHGRTRERPLEWGVFTDRLIGCVGVTRHLGYWYGRAHWGKGYATEAATAALDAYFAEADATTIVSGAFDENVMSQRVLAKLGFVETGCSMKYSTARNALVSHVDMLLERTAWVERRVHSSEIPLSP